MSDIRYLLKNSMLHKHTATFPTLTPSSYQIATPDEAVIVLAQCALAQCAWLNAFAGLAVKDLYENIGQNSNAANALAMCVLRATGEPEAATEDVIDSIQVQDEAQAREYASIFSGAATAGGVTVDEDNLEAMWSIQNEWIDAEITRLSSLLSLLEQAETIEPPNLDDATSRGLWSWITGLPALAARLEPHIAMALRIIEVADAAINVGSFAYAIYKRFWVEKETLRNLPKALIALCRMTIELLRKIRQIPASAANFEMRQAMVTDLTERLEQQMQFFITGQNQYVLPSTMAAGLEQLTQALQDLMYKDESIDFGGVHVATHSKLITEP